MPSQTYNTAGTFTWTCPAGVTSVQVECWGPGGNGANSKYFSPYGTWSGGGGGGGAYAKRNAVSVSPGTNYSVVIGAHGSTTKTTFAGAACAADYGQSGSEPPGAFSTGSGGAAGQAVNSTGDVLTSGTTGGNGGSPYGGLGGGAGNGGGNANGGGFGSAATAGTIPGGGGGGGSSYNGVNFGASGADGQVVLTWTSPTVTGSGASQVSVGGSSGTAAQTFSGSGQGSIRVASSGSGFETFSGSGSSRTQPLSSGTGVGAESTSKLFCASSGTGLCIPPPITGSGASSISTAQSGSSTLKFQGAAASIVRASVTSSGALVFSGAGASKGAVGSTGSGSKLLLPINRANPLQVRRARL